MTFARIRCDATGRPAAVFDSSSRSAPVGGGTFTPISLLRLHGKISLSVGNARTAHEKNGLLPEKSLLLFCSSLQGLKLWFTATGLLHGSAWHSPGDDASCR